MCFFHNENLPAVPRGSAKKRRQRRRRRIETLKEQGLFDYQKAITQRLRKEVAMREGNVRADRRFWYMSSRTLAIRFEGRRGSSWRAMATKCFYTKPPLSAKDFPVGQQSPLPSSYPRSCHIPSR